MNQIQHVLDETMDTGAWRTFDAKGALLESGVISGAKVTHKIGSAAKVVVGREVYENIEKKLADMKARFAREDERDRAMMDAAAAKRARKNARRLRLRGY